MSDVKKRLIIENNELLEKINKLENFINSDAYIKLDEYNKAMLTLQFQTMKTYSKILTIRIEIFKDIKEEKIDE